MTSNHEAGPPAGLQPGAFAFALPLAARWRSVLLVPAAAAVLGYGATYLVRPIFTAHAMFLPPQQQQSGAAAALSSLGALAGLAGNAAARSPAEQFVSLMQSDRVTDRLIDRYKLIERYDERYRIEARKELARRSNFVVGKKDGLITVQVEDEDPKTAAALANNYVSELRVVTSQLAISEAQQRRVFFQTQLEQVKDKLVAAQTSLQASGFNPGAINAEPRAAAETYASLRAQLTTAQVKLQALRSTLADTNGEVLRQRALVEALQAKTDEQEAAAAPTDSRQADYIGKYREFKYQETLFDQMARQYELARVDEAREGALIQVVDAAQPPERKSRPKRVLIGLGAGFAVGLLYALWLVGRARWQAALADEAFARQVAAMRTAAFRR